MSNPSDWPLPHGSSRFMMPKRIVQQLADSPVSQGIYPLSIGCYRQAKNHRMQRNKHDNFLLIYCLGGQGQLNLQQHNIAISAGDLIILPANTPHSYNASPNDPWTIYWVHFSGTQTSDFMAHLINNNQKYLVTPLGLHSRLVNDFEALLEVRQTGYNINACFMAANQLRQILTHIALLKPVKNQAIAKQTLDLEKIHSLMVAHAEEQLNLDSLAAAANLSKYHFINKYKALTGTTPINHFINIKIERACHLLDTSQKSISEIAYILGYEDAYYFSRIFKKVMGLPPRQYRNIRLGRQLEQNIYIDKSEDASIKK